MKLQAKKMKNLFLFFFASRVWGPGKAIVRIRKAPQVLIKIPCFMLEASTVIKVWGQSKLLQTGGDELGKMQTGGSQICIVIEVN